MILFIYVLFAFLEVLAIRRCDPTIRMGRGGFPSMEEGAGFGTQNARNALKMNNFVNHPSSSNHPETA